MRQKIGPMISAETETWIKQNFENLNQGATYALDAFPALYARTLHDLRGKFSAAELRLMADVMNATALTPMIAGQHLAINVRDGIELDRLDEKWGVQKEEILRKLDLPIFALACLEIWIQAFWEHGSKNKGGLETWIKRLL